jgi:hypothetical protein
VIYHRQIIKLQLTINKYKIVHLITVSFNVQNARIDITMLIKFAILLATFVKNGIYKMDNAHLVMEVMSYCLENVHLRILSAQ